MASVSNAAPATRTYLVRQAFRLEWFTVAWMTIEAAVAIGSGIAAHSLTLIALESTVLSSSRRLEC